jgi:hypothetical protein
MSVGYFLINATKRERVLFVHVAASTQRELAGLPAAAAITTWYLLKHSGDEIAFISDTNGEWPFGDGNRPDLSTYLDVTDKVIEELITVGVLAEDEPEVFDPADPNVYMRRLRNVWML